MNKKRRHDSFRLSYTTLSFTRCITLFRNSSVYCQQMSAVVLFGASGYLIYKLFIYRHFIGVNVEYPAILLLMMAIITCSIAWIGWRTTKSMHQIHVIIVSTYTVNFVTQLVIIRQYLFKHVVI